MLNKNIKSLFLAVIVTIFTVIPSQAFEGNSKKIVLDNGLTVLVTEVPGSPTVSVYALVKAGAATEGKFLGSGISHFLEHMVFKGTEKRKVGEIAALIQSLGGNINASTGLDHTIFTIDIPVDHFDTALDITADMLMHSGFDAGELEKERKVIFGEMRLHNDNPDRKLSELVFRNVYLNHPYRHPVIGYESSFAGISRQDILDYYHTYYIPNNIVFSVAGDIKIDEVMPKIKEAFKDFKRGPEITRNLPQESPQIFVRYAEEEYPTDLTRISIAFDGVNMLNPDMYALDVLSRILGSGESSRLYLDLYKKKNLVFSVAASNFTPVDRGVFEVECLLEEDKVGQAVEEIKKHILDIQQRGVRKDELEKIKKQMIGEEIRGHLASSDINYETAYNEAYTGDYLFSKKYLEQIRRLTPEDIKRVANQYLNLSAYTLAVLKPKKEKEAQAVASENVVKTNIEKIVLDNGLTLLLKEDHSQPIVFVNLFLQGGVRQEPAELNGLSKMTGLLWTQGTKSKNAEQIARLTESLGIGLNSFSGRNSFGVQMSYLPEDQLTALNLLEELVKSPSFTQNEMEKMRDNLKVSIRGKEDNIGQVSGRALRQLLFQKHPFRLEEEGTVKTLDKITRDDIVDFYRWLAVPNNMVLTVFGDIKSEEIKKIVQKKFGNLKKKEVFLKRHTEKPFYRMRLKNHSMDKEQAMVMVGFHGVTVKDKDRYALEVLDGILSSSFSGRLFTKVREELGQAYTMGGSSIPGIDEGFIFLYVLTNKENVDKVKNLIFDQIKDVQNKLISDEELAGVKSYLKGTFKMGLETNSALSYTVGLDELYGLGYNYYSEFDALIDAVTKEDIQKAARKYLNLKSSAVVITTPQEVKQESLQR